MLFNLPKSLIEAAAAVKKSTPPAQVAVKSNNTSANLHKRERELASNQNANRASKNHKDIDESVNVNPQITDAVTVAEAKKSKIDVEKAMNDRYKIKNGKIYKKPAATNEEVEQIDELSSATRSSYRAKASDSAKKLRGQLGVANKIKSDDKDVQSAASSVKKSIKRKLNNRVDGILRSTQKEEIEYDVELDESEIALIEQELLDEVMQEGMNYHASLNKTHKAMDTAKRQLHKNSGATPAQRARAHIQHSFLQRHAEYLRRKISGSTSARKPIPGKYKKSMREAAEVQFSDEELERIKNIMDS